MKEKTFKCGPYEFTKEEKDTVGDLLAEIQQTIMAFTAKKGEKMTTDILVTALSLLVAQTVDAIAERYTIPAKEYVLASTISYMVEELLESMGHDVDKQKETFLKDAENNFMPN